MKRLLFVDDETRILQGLQRQLRVMKDEWQMDFVDSGPKALAFLAANPVDVLVTDMLMPGMDGAQLLTEVMNRHPHTVRLVLSGHADREAVLRLVGPAHQYLSKPCNPEELRAAISRTFQLRGLLASEQLKQLASRIPCLPSLPSSHAQLTQELQKPDPSVEVVAEIISRDIGITTKILQLVNSAFFGLPQPATNIMDAVVYLGLANMRALVLSTQLFSQFDSRMIKAFSIDGIARHCWMTGVLARRLADFEQHNPKISDQCFLSGLLHDIGYLILAGALPEQYARVLQTAKETGRPVWEVERAELGASHAEVGAYLLGLWGLPAPVIEAIAYHHRPADAAHRAFSPVIAVHVADAFAHGLMPTQPEQAGIEIDKEFLAGIGLDGRIESWREHCIHDGVSCL